MKELKKKAEQQFMEARQTTQRVSQWRSMLVVTVTLMFFKFIVNLHSSERSDVCITKINTSYYLSSQI